MEGFVLDEDLDKKYFNMPCSNGILASRSRIRQKSSNSYSLIDNS